ncbi:hypothetical protein VCYphi_gp09 [Vibrio phage VCY]|uniref:Uncharacterized protein n=1 Tax=Vibrio phage VCY TaxID=1105327 RepID=G8IRV2_9VIRU|nr:hypothetical protein [Vibrio cholerae]YP_004934231.1 hypothetical protein VCYphi_gp09 [Vibrio phage VCY-phi]AER41424.1 hypothetical protein [Vibrio phage VCY-phi]EGR1858286.1 hypothetical protein [Vibrio cholerae]KQA78793.1 hypothetical protein XV86_16815 [Vibrio cholerae]KQA88204.1 hypothetical protein XV88_12895 [Vibrio cholerae]PAR75720.1 hypothetical protein CGT86_15815 [Vibrio cholerae]
MEQIVITVDQFATFMEAAFFSNLLAVFLALFLYDLLTFFLESFFTRMRERMKKISTETVDN